MWRGGGHLWLSLRVSHLITLVRLVKLKEKKKNQERESLSFPYVKRNKGANPFSCLSHFGGFSEDLSQGIRNSRKA